MSQIYEFSEVIQAHKSGGAFVIIPFDVETAFGKKRVKIKAWFEGVVYRGTLVRMGSPDHILIIKKDIRKQIQKEAGDVVAVKLMEDTEPRIVVVPDDFQELLNGDEGVNEFYKKLSYTHQKEYVNWITGAKRQETRERRMKKAIEMMRKGKKGV